MATNQKKKPSNAPAPHVHTKHLRYSRGAGLILIVALLIFIGLAMYIHGENVNKSVTIPQGIFETSY